MDCALYPVQSKKEHIVQARHWPVFAKLLKPLQESDSQLEKRHVSSARLQNRDNFAEPINNSKIYRRFNKEFSLIMN